MHNCSVGLLSRCVCRAFVALCNRLLHRGMTCVFSRNRPEQLTDSVLPNDIASSVRMKKRKFPAPQAVQNAGGETARHANGAIRRPA